MDGQARLVGPAFTLRFTPGREDLSSPDALASNTSTRHAIETADAGSVLVAGAHGIKDAGVFGDILCARAQVRGLAGLVTDGAMRDLQGLKTAGLPVWCDGIAPPPSYAGLAFMGWQEAVGCGGVTVMPGDMIVADDDGVVVIPIAILDEVTSEAVDQEAFEDWVMAEVRAGALLPDLYPPSEETRQRYLKARSNT